MKYVLLFACTEEFARDLEAMVLGTRSASRGNRYAIANTA
jgi:hypothetical protein